MKRIFIGFIYSRPIQHAAVYLLGLVEEAEEVSTFPIPFRKESDDEK